MVSVVELLSSNHSNLNQHREIKNEQNNQSKIDGDRETTTRGMNKGIENKISKAKLLFVIENNNIDLLFISSYMGLYRILSKGLT